jgi:hypothetical protein
MGRSFFSWAVSGGSSLLRGASWTTCFRNWKYFAQAWVKGSIPAKPSQKAAKAERIITVFAGI